MPQIPIHSSQTRVSGTQIDTRRASGEDFGAGVGRALQGVGGETRHFAEILKRKEEDEALLANEELEARAREHWDRRMLEARDTSAPGAKGFSDGFLAEFDAWQEKTLNEVESDFGRQQLRRQLTQMRAGYFRKAVTFEAEAGVSHRVETTVKVIEDGVNAVRLDPSNAADVSEQINRMLDNARMPGNAREKLRQNADEGIAGAQIGGMLDRAQSSGQVGAVIKALRTDPQWAKRLSESDFKRALDHAEALQKQLRAQAEAEFVSGFAEAIREEQYGTPSNFSEQAIRANVSGKRADKMIEALRHARGIGEQNAWVRSASTPEIIDHANTLQARLDTPSAPGQPSDFDETMEELKFLKLAVDRREAAFAEDRVAYVTRNNDRVEKARTAFAENPTPEATANVASALRAAQLNLKPELQETEIYLLDKSQLAQVRTMFNSIEHTEEGAEKSTQLLGQLANQWGKYWPQVYAQLTAEEVITGAHVVAARVAQTDPVTSQEIMRATTRGEEELKKGIAVVGLDSQLHEQITDELADIRQGLVGHLGGDARYSEMYTTTRLMALQALKDNRAESVTEAVRDAADKIVNKQNEFFGSFWVPKDKVGDPGVIADGAHVALTNLDMSNVVLPVSVSGLSQDEVRAATQSILRDRAVWKNTGDGTGLELVWTEGNGEHSKAQFETLGVRAPIRYTWDELEAFGAGIGADATASQREHERRLRERARATGINP